MKEINRNIAKRAPIVHRAWMNHLLMFVCVVSIVSCGGEGASDAGTQQSPTTSGTVGPFVPTSSLGIDTDIVYRERIAAGFFVIRLSDIRVGHSLRLGSGDSLLVAINNIPQPVQEREKVSCGYFGTPCAFFYDYNVTLTADPGNQAVTISLQRSSDVSSNTTVTLPSSPIMTQPAAGYAFSVTTDSLDIALAPGQVGSFTKLEFPATCVDKLQTIMFADSGPFSVSIPPGTFTFSTAPYCLAITEQPLQLTTTRYHTFYPGAPLAATSTISLTLENGVTIVARR